MSKKPENHALAANYARISAGRSIEAMRTAMKDVGIDIGAGTLHRISLGDEGVRTESLRKLAQFAGIELDELLRTAEEDAEFVEVARANVRISNGRGKLIFEEGRMSALSFRRDYLRHIGVSPVHAVIVNADGRSNEPEIIDGSVLLANRAPGQSIVNGKFYAFRYDGELMIKKLYRRDDGKVLAVSANPDKDEYPDRIYGTDETAFDLIGRVLWAAHEL
ncbi:S24 family peptidase [Paracidovorax citrulli]|uniref:S24 family peptidase n=1 Tax=Paracidovorax citrulli TaxID=80869 RepID=UPI000A94FDCC|nr:helix-turn-helix transcriptional regulator [Paracidovorax citrulli]